jgi:ribosomal-protein-alanine N-acetyltransferase
MGDLPRGKQGDGGAPGALTELRTERLRLRRWTPDDCEPFAQLNSDPKVMEYFASLLTREQSAAAAARITAHFDEHGFGLWAVEVPDVLRFAGFIGLSMPTFRAHFTPCVEVGWRLAPAVWGHGYATEGARAALAFGFDTLGLDEIVSFTTAAHTRSRHVMERIGMSHDPADDFDHPSIPEGHPLRRHVLYRVRAVRSPGSTGRNGGGAEPSHARART